MVAAQPQVETSAKIAMSLPSKARLAVDLLPAGKERRRNPSPLSPLLRGHAEGSGKALAVMRPDLGVDDARRPLAVERIQNLLGGDAAHVFARLPRNASGVRARQHIVELQERMLRRRRLLGPDVEAC